MEHWVGAILKWTGPTEYIWLNFILGRQAWWWAAGHKSYPNFNNIPSQDHVSGHKYPISKGGLLFGTLLILCLAVFQIHGTSLFTYFPISVHGKITEQLVTTKALEMRKY